MTVTDEAKLFAIRQQLLEMRYKLDASINIINYVFDRDGTGCEDTPGIQSCSDTDTGDTLGLFPGQLKPLPDYTDTDPEEPEIGIEEVVECVE